MPSALGGLPEGALRSVEALQSLAPKGTPRDALLKLLSAHEFDLQRAADALLTGAWLEDWSDVGKRGKAAPAATPAPAPRGARAAKAKKGKKQDAAAEVKPPLAAIEATARRKAAAKAKAGSGMVAAPGAQQPPAGAPAAAAAAAAAALAPGAPGAGAAGAATAAHAAAEAAAAQHAPTPCGAAIAAAGAATGAAVAHARQLGAQNAAFVQMRFAELRRALDAREAALLGKCARVGETVIAQQAAQGDQLTVFLRSFEAKEATGEPVDADEPKRRQAELAARLEGLLGALHPQVLFGGWDPRTHDTLLKALGFYGAVQEPGQAASTPPQVAVAPTPAPVPPAAAAVPAAAPGQARAAAPRLAPSAAKGVATRHVLLGVEVAKTLDDPAILFAGGTAAATQAASQGEFASRKQGAGAVDGAAKAAMEAAAKQLRDMAH